MTRATVDPGRVGTIVLVAVGLVVAIPVALAAVPQLAGADHSYVVLSSSMEPAIEAGGLVFVSEVSPGEIEVGDVITYETAGAGDTTPTTHRVVEVRQEGDSVAFRTKGDANEVIDRDPVPARNVVGRVTVDVPLLGHVVNFANSTLGLLVLVIVPAIVLVGAEVRDVLAAVGEEPTLGPDSVRDTQPAGDADD